MADDRDFKKTTTARSTRRKVDENSNSNNNGLKTRNNIDPISNGDEVANGLKSAANDKGGILDNLMHYTLGPLFLMLFAPSSNILLWYTVFHCDGSFFKLMTLFAERGFSEAIGLILSSAIVTSSTATYLILGYMAWALVLMILVPGPRVNGPLTPKGNVPVYKDNGFYCYVITMLAFCGLTVYLKQHGLSPTLVYDHIGEILWTLTAFSHALVFFLMFKGLFFPSTSDSGSSGNPIFDYFWGMELYPRVFGVDIKVFTNCRFGMTVWPLLVCIFAIKSYELHGFVDSIWVSGALQMIYCTKFFWWESGYMSTIDIMVDRAGFMICWGCLAFIPGVYASVSMYLVSNPVQLGMPLSILLLAMGTAAVAINYHSDMQKQEVRGSDGKSSVWGRPAEVLRVKYQLETGESRSSLLLVSGWWGLARHFNYVPELCLALSWSLPALFDNFLPYFYFTFLVVLLVNRTYRDDEKCKKKYKQYWEEYCKRVPYKMIPGVF